MRKVALLAAVPRQFDQDVLTPLLGDDTAKMFQWLAEQSYIRRDTERGWFYHEKVRELMLRFQRNTAPRALSRTMLDRQHILLVCRENWNYLPMRLIKARRGDTTKPNASIIYSVLRRRNTGCR